MILEPVVTPTVELNALAMKLGYQTEYKNIDNLHVAPAHLPHYIFNNGPPVIDLRRMPFS